MVVAALAGGEMMVCEWSSASRDSCYAKSRDETDNDVQQALNLSFFKSNFVQLSHFPSLFLVHSVLTRERFY
jgi:hypothetical protein